MVCLGFEPGPQDGRRRRNHGAMAATQLISRSMELFSRRNRPKLESVVLKHTKKLCTAMFDTRLGCSSPSTKKLHGQSLNYLCIGVVAQLVEQSLPTPEIRGSNPVIGNLLYWSFICLLSTVPIEKKKIKKKRPGMAHFIKKQTRMKKLIKFAGFLFVHNE